MGAEKYTMFKLGVMDKGERNSITDVAGVKVGQVSLRGEGIRTGVTAIVPHGGNMFREKLPCAAHVINGFGKSVGMVQITELGTLETPILLTNTFGVGTCANALIKYMLGQNDDIGVSTSTVNPVVMECNDGYLNDIRGMHVTEADALRAIDVADVTFEEGDVGAGSGMSCYSLKGGIGTASRTFELYGKKYTLGALVLSNFGSLRDLTIAGEKIGQRIIDKRAKDEVDKGSIIMVIATDAPLSCRQLGRAARRAQSGLARTGSISGNGSGEIAVAFSTAARIPHDRVEKPISVDCLYEDDMDKVFRATIECVEESVVSSMLHAHDVTGFMGHSRETLAKYIG